ncbi:MAG TPA: hypothetical protein PK323_06300 [Bacteroidia bacterium]|nr:hypothetical protein [Bacteroidia bacterium]
MKSASSNEIKSALHNLNPNELMQICLRLAKHKKENKELLSYLLYEADNEIQYIEHIKLEIEQHFSNLTASNFSNLLKKIRKVVRIANKYIKFSGKRNVEVAVLIYVCQQLKPYTKQASSVALMNLYHRQIMKINKALIQLEEDLQYDYKQEIESIQIP